MDRGRVDPVKIFLPSSFITTQNLVAVRQGLPEHRRSPKHHRRPRVLDLSEHCRSPNPNTSPKPNPNQNPNPNLNRSSAVICDVQTDQAQVIYGDV